MKSFNKSIDAISHPSGKVILLPECHGCQSLNRGFSFDRSQRQWMKDSVFVSFRLFRNYRNINGRSFFSLNEFPSLKIKSLFCRSFKEKEIFWQKVSIHSRIKESWIFYLNISFVRRCRVLNGMVKQDFLLLNQDHETFFYSYHLLSWCCLIEELVKEATSWTLSLELSSFSFQTLLIRLITF